MKVSIGIPFFNAELYFADAIKSVIQQSFQDWELILVDDGSTDRSLEIAKQFAKKDSRIRVISDGKNKKLPARLNQIIQEAKYDYIARMDADDLMHPNRIEIQLNILKENPSYDLISTGLVSIDDKNYVKGYRNVHNIIKADGSSNSFPIIHASILAKKSWCERNQYSLNFPRAEDYELWCRTAKKNDLRIIVLPDLLYFCREEGNIFPSKLISSYRDGYSIRKLYNLGGGATDYLKVILKCSIVRFLGVFNMEQILSKARNKEFLDKNDLKSMQKILNKIVSY